MANILVFPSTNRFDNQINAKEYPYFSQLIKLLEKKGHTVIQIGSRTDQPITPMFIHNTNWKVLETLIKNCDFWISIDTFIQHFVKTQNLNKRGIVLWGPSNPKHFGYSDNLNIVKDSKFFRQEQYKWWKDFPPDTKYWFSPNELLNIIQKEFQL